MNFLTSPSAPPAPSTETIKSPESNFDAFLPLTQPCVDEATIAGVVEVLQSGWITSGPQVQKFEAALSEYFGGRPVRAFNSGTATLEIALRIAGIGPGDEVITTPLSWVATSNTILTVGAKPVFVDIDPATRLIDLNLVENAITPATRAIMPVDLAGQPVNRDQLYALAKKYKLRVIEDAAQSMGSHWGEQRIGALGDLVSFSFHANKNMTTTEGGALVFNTEEEAQLASKYRLQGVTRTGFDGMEVDILGGKFNLTDVAARIGLGQLAQIDAFNARRAQLAQLYFEAFKQGPAYTLGMGLPPQEAFSQSNWHMFQITLPLARLSMSRAEFMEQLKAHGIGSGVHYPAIHLFKLYRALGFYEGMFPHAESIGASIVTLPLFPAMRDSDVERVCATVNQLFKHSARA